jgi:uncharacterized protein (TIGR03790 family)
MKHTALLFGAVAGLLGICRWIELPAHAQKAPSKRVAPAIKVAVAAPVKAAPEAAATVVVYNQRDSASVELAQYYAGKRGIPKDHLVPISCAAQEDINRLDFDREIAGPLREMFQKRGWWKLRNEESPSGQVMESTVRYMVLIRGVPLRITPHYEPYEGDKPAGPPQISTRNEAALDSELSILGVYSRVISGALNNPYFQSTLPIGEANLPPMLLVCRLDGPTPEIVRRMIDDSIAAEQRGLRGFAYIDARGTKEKGFVEGDKWLVGAAAVARRRGLPTVFDIGEGMFPAPYPMTHAALYLGWYSEHVAGPFVRPDFKFDRGAVAVHIHSFSASTLRDPKRNWCAPLLASGAAATLGNVYEPYLGLTTNLDVFFERLRAGFTFGESCYMGQQFLSWMSTFVGDPLYRPYPKDEKATAEGPQDEWEGYRLGAQAFFDQGAEAGTKMLKASGQKYQSGMIFEGLGLLQLAANDTTNAINSFEQAATLYRQPSDILRATIHEVFQLKALGRTDDAIALARKRLNQYPRQTGSEVLKVVEAEMTMAAGGTGLRR